MTETAGYTLHRGPAMVYDGFWGGGGAINCKMINAYARAFTSSPAFTFHNKIGPG